MVITIGSIKGGVGKSTLAINFAIALAIDGQRVLLVDTDEQRTALAFAQIRAKEQPQRPQYNTVELTGMAVRNNILAYTKPSYDQVVIDAGGRDTRSLRAALTVSDLVIIPTQPRSFDVWGVIQTMTAVREVRELQPKLSALVVINCADSVGTSNQEALDAFREITDLEVSPHLLTRRKAFATAADAGLGVLERGSSKAQEEFGALYESLYKPVKLRRKKIA